MLTGYTYELWNGREVVGYCHLHFPLRGTHMKVHEFSILKQPYGQKPKSFEVPIVSRVISDNGVDIVIRRCLDVRHKSKRQLAKIREQS